MDTTISSSHIRDGTVWLTAQGGLTVDLPNPAEFDYGSVVRALSSDGQRHSDDLRQSYQFTEDEFSSIAARFPQPSGVQALLVPAVTPDDMDLHDLGTELIKALASSDITFLVIQLVVITDSTVALRILALGPNAAAEAQSVGHVVIATLGTSVIATNQRIDAVTRVGSSPRVSV
jgi:hypothetical protein